MLQSVVPWSRMDDIPPWMRTTGSVKIDGEGASGLKVMLGSFSQPHFHHRIRMSCPLYSLIVCSNKGVGP